MVQPSFFVNMDNINHLSTCGSNLRELLEHIGWSNVLTIEENVYLSLVKVFHLNIDISLVIKIEWSPMYPGLLLNVTDLIMILEIRNDGLHLYTTKKELEFPKYTYV